MTQAAYSIKENSFIARIAAMKLKSKSLAIVLGNTIHLHNICKQDFLKDEAWLKHELCHIEQFKTHGTIPFVIKYLYESILHGYHNNKFEIAAREAELR